MATEVHMAPPTRAEAWQQWQRWFVGYVSMVRSGSSIHFVRNKAAQRLLVVFSCFPNLLSVLPMKRNILGCRVVVS